MFCMHHIFFVYAKFQFRLCACFTFANSINPKLHFSGGHTSFWQRQLRAMIGLKCIISPRRKTMCTWKRPSPATPSKVQSKILAKRHCHYTSTITITLGSNSCGYHSDHWCPNAEWLCISVLSGFTPLFVPLLFGTAPSHFSIPWVY